MANKITSGSSSAGLLNIDSTFNAQTNLPYTTAAGTAIGGGNSVAGFATVQHEIDPGAVVGSRTTRSPTSSVFNRQSIGLDSILFSDYMNAGAQNTAIWKSAINLFTFGFNQNGYLKFNNSAITTTAASQLYQSYRSFTLFGSSPLMFEFSEFRTAVPPSNTVFDVGFMLAPTAAPNAPTDGAYLRFNSSGLTGVLNFNGTESTQLLLTAGSLVLNDNTTYRIVVDHYRVEFWGASSTSAPRILLGVFPVPSTNGPPFASLNLPIGARYTHTGTAGAAYSPQIANFVVVQQDINQERIGSNTFNAMGFSPYQGGNGDTMGSTQLYTNSLAPGAGAVMTNTTAALGTGFGGQFSALPTLAANTDGILCSFQNAASAVNQTGSTVYITGIKIQGCVTTVLAGNATPVVYAYSLAFGHTAVSMATAEAAAAKAPRRIALGYESYAAAAAVGTLGQGVQMSFPSAIPINQGEFIAICAKNVGVVTTTGVITFLVTYEGYQE